MALLTKELDETSFNEKERRRTKSAAVSRLNVRSGEMGRGLEEKVPSSSSYLWDVFLYLRLAERKKKKKAEGY